MELGGPSPLQVIFAMAAIVLAAFAIAWEEFVHRPPTMLEWLLFLVVVGVLVTAAIHDTKKPQTKQKGELR